MKICPVGPSLQNLLDFSMPVGRKLEEEDEKFWKEFDEKIAFIKK